MPLLDKAKKAGKKINTQKSSAAIDELKGHSSMKQSSEPVQDKVKIEESVEIIDIPEIFKTLSGMNKKIQGDYPAEFHEYLTDVAYQRTKNHPNKKKVAAKDILIEAIYLHYKHFNTDQEK